MSWYYIVNQATGLVLDISGGKKQGSIIIWGKHGGDNQLWRLEGNGLLRSKLGTVIDICHGDKKAGAKLIAYPKHGGENQLWKRNGNQIVSMLNSMVMDVEGGSTKAGTSVIMWPSHGGKNQQWTFEAKDAKDVTWEITSVGYESVLGVPAGLVEEKTLVVGLESESKEDESSVNWKFTENKWGVSGDASVDANWGWGSTSVKVSSYSDNKTQEMVQNMKSRFKRDYKKITTTTKTSYTGPVYVHQAVMVLKSSKGMVRTIRSEYYVISTKTPNADFDPYINMSKF